MLSVGIFSWILLPINAAQYKSSPKDALAMNLKDLLGIPTSNSFIDFEKNHPSFNLGESCRSDQFLIEKTISTSEISSVFKAQYKGQSVMLKKYHVAKFYDVINKELVLSLNLYHSNLSRGICTFIGHDNSVNLVTEYIGSNTLAKRLKTPEASNPVNQQKFAKQMVDVLLYLHELNIFHNDIRPENILVTDDWDVKLINFGLASYCPDGSYNQKIGSIEYMAPEKFTGKSYNNGADWYAFGLTLYELIHKKNPYYFIDMSPSKLVAIMKRGIQGLTNSVADDFISKTCDPDNYQRWCPANGNSQDILNHPFLNSQM